jgi:hypothetical protein
MDITTVILIVVIVALVMFFLNRNRTVSRGPTYNDQAYPGNERPTYDDPNYSSSGSIGGDINTAPQHHERLQERSVGESAPAQRPQHDDPNYRSGGSIGG